MKIRTEYDPKPIPLRDCDWVAVDDETYDGPGAPIGTGATEQEAIEHLLELLEAEREAERSAEEQRDGEEQRYQAYRDRDIDGSW